MIKNFITILFLAGLSSISGAQSEHVHHARHNMVLFGESEIFASHIVYKIPHNYQVILKLSLNEADKEIYLKAKKEHPSEQFIYRLDAFNMKEITAQQFISGTVLYVDSEDHDQKIISNLKVISDDFKIIYFDELPLSLTK